MYLSQSQLTPGLENDPPVEEDLLYSGETVRTEEVYPEFFINDEGDAVPTSNSVGEAEFVPQTNTNDHNYVLMESEPSPQTERWGDLGKEVDMKLRVEEHGACLYSPQNRQYHIKSQGKFAIIAKMTGL